MHAGSPSCGRAGSTLSGRTGPVGPVVALVVLLAGCSSAEPAAQPAARTSPSVPASASPLPSPSPSPSPSPTPSPSPLSAYEADPAVIALRANLRASSAAINARDLALPELLATTTARRAARYPVIFATDLKTYFPGPRPVALLGVRSLSPTAKSLLACSLEGGFGLDRKGGRPVEPRKVTGGTFQMLLVRGAWKVDRATADPSVSCVGVSLPGSPG